MATTSHADRSVVRRALALCYALERGSRRARRSETDTAALCRALDDDGFREGDWLSTRSAVAYVAPTGFALMCAWIWIWLLTHFQPLPWQVALCVATMELPVIVLGLVVAGAELAAPEIARRGEGIELRFRDGH